MLRSAPLLERTGRRIMPQLAGVTLTEAVKDAYAGVPTATATVKRRVVLVDSAG